MSRSAFALASLLVLSALTPAAPARAVVLGDSTAIDSWRLANGLEVRVRSIPRAAGASVSLAYRAGSLHVPAGHAGLADLLAELQYTAAAGDIPERTRDGLDRLRPAGWELRVNDHVSVLTEVASPSQLPGVLLQVATRAHGVKVSDACFAAAAATVRGSLGRATLGDASVVLHRRAREVALGVDDARIFEDGLGRGIAGIGAGEAGRLLQRLYVPANATLALAGDFGNVDVRALVDKLFGDIPAGRAEPEAPSRVLRAGARIGTLPGLATPVGVVAALAPSLDDTLHAEFYLASLLAGAFWSDREGAPRAPLTTLFRYSVFDEPDLVRFYLQPTPGMSDTTAVLTDWAQAIDDLRAQTFTAPMLDQTRRSVDWFLGGPVMPGMLSIMRRDPSALLVLSAGMATRACWRGDAFWDDWRRRFETGGMTPQMMLSYLNVPDRQVVLLLRPR